MGHCVGTGVEGAVSERLTRQSVDGVGYLSRSLKWVLGPVLSQEHGAAPQRCILLQMPIACAIARLLLSLAICLCFCLGCRPEAVDMCTALCKVRGRGCGC